MSWDCSSLRFAAHTGEQWQSFWRAANTWVDMVSMAVEDDLQAHAGWLLTQASKLGWYPVAGAPVYRDSLTMTAIINHKGRSVAQHCEQMGRRRPVVHPAIGGPTPTVPPDQEAPARLLLAEYPER
jgi:hypothetical protein